MAVLWRPLVIGRRDNVVQVDFRREPDPPAPRFPGGAAMRPSESTDSSPSCPATLPWTAVQGRALVAGA